MKKRMLEADYSQIKNDQLLISIGIIMLIIGVAMIITSIIIEMFVWIGFWVVVSIFGGILLFANIEKKNIQKTNLTEKINALNGFLSGKDIFVGQGNSYKKVSLSKGYELSKDLKTLSNKNNLFELDKNTIKDFNPSAGDKRDIRDSNYSNIPSNMSNMTAGLAMTTAIRL